MTSQSDKVKTFSLEKARWVITDVFGEQYLPAYQELRAAIATALDEAREKAFEEAAQFIEDDRYNLPGREAEWSRFIARKVRALKAREREK